MRVKRTKSRVLGKFRNNKRAEEPRASRFGRKGHRDEVIQNVNPWPHTAAKETGNIVFILGDHGPVKTQGFYYCGRRGEKTLGGN